MKRLLLLLTGASVGLALVGCGGGPPPAVSEGETNTSTGMSVGGDTEPPSVAGKYGGSITDSTISDPKSLNLWVSSETSTSDIVGRLYEGLNQRNQFTLQHEPRLADLPQISADGLTYTYKLREGTQWSDGTPLTTDDVIFTLDLIFDTKIETSLRDILLIDVVKADGTEAKEPFKYRKVDDRTVEFTLPQPFAPAQDIFSFSIAPKHVLEGPYKAGTFNSTWGVSTPVSKLVSSSPWIIHEYVPRQRIIFKRNPRYWDKTEDGKPLPYMDQTVTLIVPDNNAGMLKFRNKDTDILEPVPHAEYPQTKRDESKDNYTLMDRGPGWGFNYLGFNMNPKAKLDKNLLALFQDVRFRRAMSHAVNRDRMVNDIFQGLAQPLYTPVTPANKLFYKPDVSQFPYDLAKAKQLLTEIGMADSDGNKMLEYRGKEVKFNILTNGNNEQRKQLATIITEDLRNIGINAQFTPIDFNELIRRLDAEPYEWQAVILGFTGGPEPHNGSSIWRSSGRLHQWHPKQKTPATEWEAQIDRLWVQGSREMDPTKRKAIYDQWQQIVAEQQPVIFTVVTNQLTALRNNYGNVKPPSTRSLLWNLEEVFDKRATGDQPTP